MKIRFQSEMFAGLRSYAAGEVAEIDDAIARRLIAGNCAAEISTSGAAVTSSTPPAATPVAEPEHVETPESSDAEHVETPAGELASSGETAVEAPAADPAGAASVEPAPAAPKKKRGRPAKAKPGVEAPADPAPENV